MRHAPAVDDRIGALVLVVAGSTGVSYPGRFPGTDLAEAIAATDPAVHARQMGPRPVLMLAADADELFPRRSAFALYAAFDPPKELSFLPGSHGEWRHPRQWNDRIVGFLARTLAPRR